MNQENTIAKKILVAQLTVSLGMVSAGAQAQVGDQEAKEIAAEGWVYLYPLVLNDLTRRQAINVETPERFGRAPVNTFQHLRCLQHLSAKPGSVINPDLLPSAAWVDVSKEPLVLTTPATGERYAFFSVFNQWSDVAFQFGNRVTGTQAANLALVAPGWKGKLPKDVEKVELPVSTVKLVGYTVVKGSDDCATANSYQDGYKLTPLSIWIKPPKNPPKPPKFKADSKVDMATPAAEQVKRMAGVDFFVAAAELLRTQRTNLTDVNVLTKLKKIGFEPGQRLDPQKLEISARMAMGEAPAVGAARIAETQQQGGQRGALGWMTTPAGQGTYGNAYLKRAAAAEFDDGAATPDDVVVQMLGVDSENSPLKGDRRYTLTFKKGEFPPPSVHWSMAVLDETGNPTGRVVQAADAGFQADKDGTVVLYLQKDSPGQARQTNWFAIPDKKPFALVFRTYRLSPEALQRGWAPPAAERIKSGNFDF